MTRHEIEEELEREPFVPLRLHLASGKTLVIKYPNTAWLRQNSLLIVFPVSARSSLIGKYDVIALPLIEKVEQIESGNGESRAGKKRRGPA
jgi:hypothetical protein